MTDLFSVRLLLGAIAMLSVVACSSTARAPMATVDHVDLDRFMGDWYVIAAIPTRFERDAFNAVESYRLTEPRRVATTFTFRKGGFDGPEKRYTPTGFVTPDASNAVWGMRFIWPFKAEYLVVYLDPDYRVTIIGRTARDYVWIMARTPELPAGELDRLLDIVTGLGYDRSEIRLVPQRW